MKLPDKLFWAAIAGLIITIVVMMFSTGCTPTAAVNDEPSGPCLDLERYTVTEVGHEGVNLVLSVEQDEDLRIVVTPDAFVYEHIGGEYWRTSAESSLFPDVEVEVCDGEPINDCGLDILIVPRIDVWPADTNAVTADVEAPCTSPLTFME